MRTRTIVRQTVFFGSGAADTTIAASGIFLLAAIAAAEPARGEVVLNELQASNDATIEDPDAPGEFDDWAEVFNSSDADVDLGGHYLTDDLERPTRWRIPPGVVVPARGFLVFWLDDDEEQGDLHAPFQLDAGGDALALVAPDGQAVLDSIEFGEQATDWSFGRAADANERWLAMPEPTPGGPNGVGAGDAPTFSVSSRTFFDAFELAIAPGDEEATIYYTLDGSEPNEEEGRKYDGPITIDATTRVRALAIEPELVPSPVVSAVYLHIDESLRDFESNLPLVVIDTLGTNVDALVARPRLFQPVLAAFIPTPGENAHASLLSPAEWAGSGGLHVRGSSTTQYPKKQYAFETWDERREDSPVSLFGMPRESDWVLQAPYSDKTLMRNHLIYGWSRAIGRYAPRTRFCEVFLRRTDGAVSESDYRGVYVLMEKIKRDDDRVDIARLDPGDDAEPEITGGYLLKKDWLTGASFFTTETYRDNLIYVDPDVSELTGAQRRWLKDHFDEFEHVLSGEDFADPGGGYAQYIDVDSFVDHHLLVELGRNVDGYVLSTFFYKQRGGKVFMGPIWDYNGALGGADYFCSFETAGWHYEFDESECGGGGETFPADNPNGYRWYARLFEDPSFRRRYAERWVEHRAGALRTENLLRDIANAASELTDDGAPESPVARNFDRWRILDTYVWPNAFPRGTYEEHVDWMREWIVGRVEWMDTQLTIPPTAEPAPGDVEPGTEVSLSAPSGEIFYTINGPDPLGPNGAPAPEARRFAGPIRVDANTRILARARLGDALWTGLLEAIYLTSRPRLAVTELMYNPGEPPEGSPFTRRNFDFLEIQNVGDTAVDLAGFAFVERLRYEFSSGAITTLAPGEFALLVQSADAFASLYGDDAPVAGEYEGILSNTAQELLLLGSVGETVVRFEYRDWYESTDGGGHSLVLVDPRSPTDSWSREDAWRPSQDPGGSPGGEDGSANPSQRRVGDLDGDARLTIADAIFLLEYLFEGDRDLPCNSPAGNRLLADVNGDERTNVSDAIYALFFLFAEGDPPARGTECLEIASCPAACGEG